LQLGFQETTHTSASSPDPLCEGSVVVICR
jgi:hypothetical protein